MDKKAQREAKIAALIDQVDEWDRARLVEFAQHETKWSLESLSDQEIDELYQEEFSED